MSYKIFWILVLTALVIRADILSTESVETEAPLRRVRRIIGGDFVEQRSFQYMVSLHATLSDTVFYPLPGGLNHFCAGTLISPKWVLTSASCMFATARNNTRVLLNNPSIWKIRLGTKSLRPTNVERFKGFFNRIYNTIYGQKKLQSYYDVEKVVLHPFYQDPILEHDLALIKFKNSISLKNLEVAKVLRLPYPAVFGSSYPPTGMNCLAVGWGSSCTGCFPEANLRAVQLPIISQASCTGSFVASINLTESKEFCAGFLNGGKSVGYGDSGSPIVCDSEGTKLLAGVASAIYAPDPANRPIIYTRVAAYTQWIMDTIKAD